MNAITPPFPTNPQIGQWFYNWVWTGSRWACVSGGVVAKIVKFTGSGPYMPSPGLVWSLVECIGGGGGGGGATATGGGGTTGWITGGGGGSSGEYARSALPAALLAGGVNITIGAGGAGGGPALAGGNGTDTAFGVIVMAAGGVGGGGSAFVGDTTPPNLWGNGGSRASVGGVGDIVSSGNAGLGGGALYWTAGVSGGVVNGGLGGLAFYGGLSQQARANGGSVSSGPPVGTNGPGFWGCGGSGGATGVPATGAWGSAGGLGVCIVTEFVVADQQGDDCIGGARVARSGVGPCPPEWGQFDQ